MRDVSFSGPPYPGHPIVIDQKGLEDFMQEFGDAIEVVEAPSDLGRVIGFEGDYPIVKRFELVLDPKGYAELVQEVERSRGGPIIITMDSPGGPVSGLEDACRNFIGSIGVIHPVDHSTTVSRLARLRLLLSEARGWRTVRNIRRQIRRLLRNPKPGQVRVTSEEILRGRP